MRAACRIRVHGLVQGVGYRPFVWRLARDLGLAGWVRNDSGGVEIAVEGPAAGIAALEARLGQEAPLRARVDSFQVRSCDVRGLSGFHIQASRSGLNATAIGPDTATCPECLAELFAPGGRRWRHAFITCTNCGPRFTLAHGLPWDRVRTGMAGFPMCPTCANEYADPADRRFHAEPIACPECGPRLSLRRIDGVACTGDAIAGALARIRAGAILAVKGLGGYHLVCDAQSTQAVARLRHRKQREGKPFAVMGASPAVLERWVVLEPAARALLEGPDAPVVLAPRRDRTSLPGVAEGLAELGVMLPAHPLQWLLFHEAAGRPAGTAWAATMSELLLVMTSANVSGEPILADDARVQGALGGIADVVLGHDRPIVMRCDDSVVRAGTVVRRARGRTPVPLRLGQPVPTVLAVGAHLKSTGCVTRAAEAFLTQHVGDLESPAGSAFLEECLRHLLGLLAVRPVAVAHDLHPDMPATHLAVRLAQEFGVRLIGVQHHHAHVAAVLAEHGCHEPVLGLALDGVGYGTDGTAWGGELLHVEGAGMRRVAGLVPLALPGGDRAAREPWRMAAAALHALDRGAEIPRRFSQERHAAALQGLLAGQVHGPRTSSLGRVFDAAAALLGIATRQSYEAEAAMRLESLALSRPTAAVPRDLWRIDAAGRLDLLPLLGWLADCTGEPAAAAAVFHATVSEALAAWAVAAARAARLSTLALGGGCLLNTLLHAQLSAKLSAAGLRVLLPRQVPPNDAAISLGQAWVAAAVVRRNG